MILGKDNLGPLPTETSRKLNIADRNRHALSVNGSQLSIFHDTNKIRFPRALQRHNSVRLETQIGVEVLRHLANETLERKLGTQ